MIENKVIYQIYPKSFKDSNNDGIGDLLGIISKLDYLQALGIDYIWLSPINVSPQYDNGYDIASYYDIDPIFGTIDDFQQLIKEAKKRDIKIMMDLVLNHTSSEHEWFKKALDGDSQYMDYYVFKDQPSAQTSIFGGSAWEYVASLKKYYLHMFDVHQPDLNWHNPQLRQELYDMINYWIKQGVEGFRLDVIGMIGKDIDNGVINYTKDFFVYLKELNNKTFKNHILSVGECWDATIDQLQSICQSDGLSEAFTFNHLGTTSIDGDKFNQQKVEFDKVLAIIKTWQNEYVGNEAIVMNNHDQPRLLSLWLNDSDYRKNSAKLLITLFGFLKGNLYLYQGEEIGMPNVSEGNINHYNDIETLNKYQELISSGLTEEESMKRIMRVSRDNARALMAWDNSAYGGFSSGLPWTKMQIDFEHINVEADLIDEDSVFHYYQELIKFRKQHPEVLKQPFSYQLDGDILSVKKGAYTLVANLGSQKHHITITDEIILKSNDELLLPYGVVVYRNIA